tara:strand:+ start:338 stop:481 length:144 start_codon:yes stop_codon:yes gene_type:complete
MPEVIYDENNNEVIYDDYGNETGYSKEWDDYSGTYIEVVTYWGEGGY